MPKKYVTAKTPIRRRRIATVKATGKRYIVERIDFPKAGPAKVTMLGAVCAASKLPNGDARIRYSGFKRFLRDAVEIEEVLFTWDVALGLWKQYCEEQGLEVWRTRGGNWKARPKQRPVWRQGDYLLPKGTERAELELAGISTAGMTEAEIAEWHSAL